jgi:hypothetical protein
MKKRNKVVPMMEHAGDAEGNFLCRKWNLMASIPRSSGEVEHSTFEGAREEAEQELWNLLEVLGVETSVTEAEDQRPG